MTSQELQEMVDHGISALYIISIQLEVYASFNVFNCREAPKKS